tara:strand:- start:3332 stop:4228 length:897 start_codon:yes stop_codon:yes gene_type:complete
MKFKKGLVSIILNCHNGEKYLKEALSSVKAQTHKNWELIFWDNRSKDRSAKIVKSFKIKKLKYYLSKHHTSLYAARNLAMKKATGEFVSFIDADDIWEKNKLKEQIKLFKDKETAVVYGNSWLKNEKKNKTKKFINYKVQGGYIYKDLIKRYNVGILTSLIKNSLLKKSKIIFDKKYNIIGDFDFFLKLSKKYKFQYISEPIAIYRIHENNFSFVNKNMQINEFKYWIKKNKTNLKPDDYSNIKHRIYNLEFIYFKFYKTFLKSLKFLLKYHKYTFNLKNIIILFLPTYFLKKFMWFI